MTAQSGTPIKFKKVATITVLREFRSSFYEFSDGEKVPCLELTRDCGLGCKCAADILKANSPTPQLAEKRCLCFNDLKKQGISEVEGTARAIKEGPDVWIYEVKAEIVQANQ